MAEIHKDNISGILWWQITLSEEAVSETNCGALINKSSALEMSDIACIEYSLSLHIRIIGWYRDDDIF